jgi:hypothetical protein
MSPAQVARALVDESERGVRLRQSHPFVDALDPDERLEILRSLSQ